MAISRNMYLLSVLALAAMPAIWASVPKGYREIACPKFGFTRASMATYASGPSYANLGSQDACDKKCKGYSFYFLNTDRDAWPECIGNVDCGQERLSEPGSEPHRLMCSQECSCSKKCIELTRTRDEENGDMPIVVGVPGQPCPPASSSKFWDVLDVEAKGPSTSFFFVGTPKACSVKCQGKGFFSLNADTFECKCYGSCTRVQVLSGVTDTYQLGYPPKKASPLSTEKCPTEYGKPVKADVVAAGQFESVSGAKSAKECISLCKGKKYYLYNSISKYCMCPSTCTIAEGASGASLEIGLVAKK